jgi:plasmid stabilization system protein ParE
VSLPVVLTPEAEADYEDAYNWYDARNPVNADRFEARVQDVYDRISANPLLHQKVFGDVRRAVVAKFPYAVLYIPEAARVVVIAVFHTSRDPRVWQRRVPPGSSP